MLNIKDIINNLDFYKEKIKEKKCFFDLDYLVFEYNEYLKYIQIEQKINQEKNILNSKAKNKDNLELIKNEAFLLNENLKEIQHNLNYHKDNYLNLLMQIPNITDKSVPIGENENDNVEIYKKGIIRNFNFEIKDHVDITKKDKFNGLNFDDATLISKNRFCIMTGKVAKLHRALINFMLNEHEKNGYIEHNVPVIVKAETLIGTGQLPKFEDDLFEVKFKENNNKFYLIPTAEVPLTNIYKNLNLTNKDLPLNLMAHTNCFRSEAGSYGKDTKGLIRQHQFEKIELVKIVEPENSMIELENITNHAEKILDLLKLPYRKVLLCNGDTGFGSIKTYDLEVWIPSQNCYREISSCSNMGDFQARRMNFKYKKNGKNEYVHTLNASGLAVGRTLVAIIENYQNENLDFDIPEILEKYF